jgi:hypothetical protein
MTKRARSSEGSWWNRHVWLSVSTCALLGALVGFAAAATIAPSDEDASFLWIESLRPLAGLSAAVAGTLLGTLGGFLLIRVGRDAIECPRCGTPNKLGAASCSACGLPLS